MLKIGSREECLMKIQWKATLKKMKRQVKSLDREQAIYFAPGIFLVILGLMTCAAPDLLVAFIASFFIFCGVFSFFLAWKFVQLKGKIKGVLKQAANAQVIVRTVAVQSTGDSDPYAESKKVILH